METLATQLADLRATFGEGRTSGFVQTDVKGVGLFWNEQPVPCAPLLYDTGIVIIGQGRKVGYLGDRRFQYDADSCLVLGVPVPFECEAHATPAEPLLGIRIDIDMTTLHSLVARFQGRLGFERYDSDASHFGVEPVRMEGELLAATQRLLASLKDPMDRQVVGPAALEEILYRVLRGEQGRVLYALTQHHTIYSHVARSLTRMHRDYQATFSVEDLARESAMSVSAFHRAFKQVTGETPLQYLKKLRLIKAKGMLVLEGKRVDEAAYQVGYVSPSQFSREFKRYFKVPPTEAASLPYSEAM